MASLFSSIIVVVQAQQILNRPEYREAMKAVATSDYESAVNSLSPLLTSEYSSAAMVEIGKIRFKQAEGEMSSALSHYYEAAGLLNSGVQTGGVKGPETPKLLYDLAGIYEERLKDYPNALNTYSKIVNEYPSYSAIDKAYYNLAACCEMLGRYEEAAQYYSIVVSNYSYSTFFKAAQEKMKKLNSATKDKSNAIEIQEELVYNAEDEEKSQANLDLGDMNVESGNYKDALTAYQSALKGMNNSEDAVGVYKKMVDVLEEKQKDYKGAVKMIDEMIQKYPNAQGTEDLIYRAGRMYEEDIDSMKKTVSSDGSVRYRKSRESMEKAIDYYDKVAEQYPDSEAAGNAALRKAEIYYNELREYGDAKSAYQDFLSKYPDHPEAKNVRKKLRELKDY